MKKNITSGLYAAIDIGTKSVKAIVIEVNNNSKRLVKTKSIELDSIDSTTSENFYKKNVKEAINKLANDLELSKCIKIISLFYNRELQVKLLDLPSTVKLDQLDQILPWEAKKLLSAHYKEEEYTYSYSITQENPVSLILAVTPTSLLKAHLELFDGTGIKPDPVYTNVFAALALQSIVDIAGLPALSIVDFGYSGTHLNIYSSGKIKFYRYIPTGTSELSNPPNDNELEMYSQKIRFSFDYFRAVSKLSQVDALFFIGGGITIPNVMNYEQNYFAPTKINPLDVSSAIDISPVISANENITTKQEKSLNLLPFIPSIGSCLADFRDNSESMDLLSIIKQQEKEAQLAKLANTIPLVLGIISVIIATTIIFFQYSDSNRKLDNIKKELELVRNEYNEYSIKVSSKKSSNESNQIKLSKESFNVVKPIIDSKDSLRNLFQIINKEATKDIQITEILIRNNQEAESIFLKSKEEIEAEKLESSQNDIKDDKNITVKTNKVSKDSYDIFAEPENQIKQDNHKKESKKKFVVKNTNSISEPLSESQIKEDFDGNIAIIHGFALNSIEVSKFSDALTTNPQNDVNIPQPSALLRYTSINMRENEDGTVEFLLKGELK